MKKWHYKIINANNKIIDSDTVITGNSGTRETAIKKAKFKAFGHNTNPFVKISVKFIEHFESNQ